VTAWSFCWTCSRELPRAPSGAFTPDSLITPSLPSRCCAILTLLSALVKPLLSFFHPGERRAKLPLRQSLELSALFWPVRCICLQPRGLRRAWARELFTSDMCILHALFLVGDRCPIPGRKTCRCQFPAFFNGLRNGLFFGCYGTGKGGKTVGLIGKRSRPAGEPRFTPRALEP